MNLMQGIPASPGIGISYPILLKYLDTLIPNYRISKRALKRETERYHHALEETRKELRDLKEELCKQVEGTDKANKVAFIDSHIAMLNDGLFTEDIIERLRVEQRNVETILHEVIREVITKWQNAENQVIRERGADLFDISRRIINHLLQREDVSVDKLERDCILVVDDLLPSDAVNIDRLRVKGLISETGGSTSHTAILAKSFGIPAVVGIPKILSQLEEHQLIIIDGFKGVVIIDPDESTLESYQREKEILEERDYYLRNLKLIANRTRDGFPKLLSANIDMPLELTVLDEYNLHGVGLMRSEFLFFDGHVPTEEDHFNAYKHILEYAKNKPVTIRTLDIGGDKLAFEGYRNEEKNPLLGLRGIRLCLRYPEIFRTQLRALLRASVYGQLKILFPMISGAIEFRRAKGIYEEIKEELLKENIPVDNNIKLGAMIEIPLAALMTDFIAQEADFISIGTNDLIQYGLAIDRNNSRVAYLHNPFHIGMLRMIKTIIDQAHKYNVPVCMCGEMAGDEKATLLLLGLGLDEFSVTGVNISKIKRIICNTRYEEAKEIADKIINTDNLDTLKELLDKWVPEHLLSFDV